MHVSLDRPHIMGHSEPRLPPPPGYSDRRPQREATGKVVCGVAPGEGYVLGRGIAALLLHGRGAALLLHVLSSTVKNSRI